MARRHRLIAVAALSIVAAAAAMSAARAQKPPTAIAIAKFDYTPQFVEVSAGDAVAWTNLDATVHTVTDEVGTFVSGSIRNGQTYTLQFDRPGVYSYFCEPHPEMRGRIVVTGTSPATAAPVAPASAPPTTVVGIRAPAPRAPAAAVPAGGPAALPAPPTDLASSAPAASTGSAPAVRASVSQGVISGGVQHVAGLLVDVAVLALVGVVLSLFLATGLDAPTGAGRVVGLLTVATAVLHLQLHFVLAYPEPIGSLMIMAAGAGALVGVYLLTNPWSPTTIAAGGAFNAIALMAFALSRSSIGLFGYHELGWDPSPQAPVAVAIEACALALVAFGLVASRRTRYSLAK